MELTDTIKSILGLSLTFIIIPFCIYYIIYKVIDINVDKITDKGLI